MGATPIEWTDFSVNPLRASLDNRTGHYCEKISPGCKNCYSSRLQPRFGLPVFQEQIRLDVRPFLDWSKLEEVLRRRKPTKFFWCDMTDMFGAWVPEEWIALCFAVMAATPQHTHQVLTKRAERMRETVSRLYADDAAVLVAAGEQLAAEMGWCHVNEHEWRAPLPSVWLGVSAEDQQRADERIPHLLATPAAVRFVSAEPLLGPIDLSAFLPVRVDRMAMREGEQSRIVGPGYMSLGARLSWVIVGGESGPSARPCERAWIRNIVRDCRKAGVPCFVKQLGSHVRDRNDVGFDGQDGDAWDLSQRLFDRGVIEHDPDGVRDEYQGAPVRIRLVDRKGGDPSEWPKDMRVREFPEARL